MSAGPVIDGYRFRERAQPCPYCGERHAAIESLGQLGRYRYVCWCGAKCELVATFDELAELGVPREVCAAIQRGDLT